MIKVDSSREIGSEYYQQREAVMRHCDPPYFTDRSGRYIGGFLAEHRAVCLECGQRNAFLLDCPDTINRAGCAECGNVWEVEMTTARLRRHLAKQAELQATLDAVWELVEQADAGPVGVGGSVPTSDLRRVLKGESGG